MSIGTVTNRPMSGAISSAGPSDVATSPASGSAPELEAPRSTSHASVTEALLAIDEALGREQSADASLRSNDLGVQRTQRAAHHARLMQALERERKAEGDGSKGLFDSVCDAVSDVVNDVAHARVADAGSDLGDDASAAWSSPKLWQDLEKSASFVSTVGTAASAPSAITGASLGASGVAHAKNASFEHDANQSRADAEETRHALDRSRRATTDTLDEMKQANAGFEQRQALLESTLQSNDETTAAAMRVRA